jgi:hypothetical protein
MNTNIRFPMTLEPLPLLCLTLVPDKLKSLFKEKKAQTEVILHARLHKYIIMKWFAMKKST